MNTRWTRRRVLAGASVAVGGLAGCIGGSDDGGGDSGMTGGEETGGNTTGSGGGGENASIDGGGSSTDDSGGEDGGNVSDGDGSSGNSSADGGSGGEDGEFDLAEANVTEVSVEEVGDREFEFSVTLYHDDDGEDGYADWWAVETKDVDELGRRELAHAHGTEEFTRSATIEIPEGVDCVVVRGHDQTHEYGGQAMLVSVPGGATEARQQGSDPEAFADAECP